MASTTSVTLNNIICAHIVGCVLEIANVLRAEESDAGRFTHNYLSQLLQQGLTVLSL